MRDFIVALSIPYSRGEADDSTGVAMFMLAIVAEVEIALHKTPVNKVDCSHAGNGRTGIRGILIHSQLLGRSCCSSSMSANRPRKAFSGVLEFSR
jgi:hypothetical protein